MHLTVATAGHIDHGKSALVQALTGTHPDRLPEEQARGISIELGFAHTVVDDVTLSFIDVPGHERFVRTMLAGVGGIDAVLLVVAADESVMPQTREHAAICRLLDVPAGVIALTRCDLADETMQAIAEDEVRELVAGTPLADAPIIRTSARTGDGIGTLRAALIACSARARPRVGDVPARLPIDRVFTVKGFGTVVTGTLWTGRLEADQDVHIAGASGDLRQVRVRGLQVHGAPAPRASAGQRTAVNLAGVSHQDVQRGDVIVAPGAAVTSRRLLVDVTMLADGPAQRHGARLHVHLGTTVAIGRLLLPRSDAADAAPRRLAPGARGRALLRLETPLAVRRGDRLVLRTYSPVTTVAGAVVEDPRPSLRRGSRAAQGAAVSLEAWLDARLVEAGPAGLPQDELPARLGVSPTDAEACLAALRARDRAMVQGARVVASEALARVRERVLAVVDRAAIDEPLAGGVPRATLQALGARRWAPGLVDGVLDALLREGVLQGDDRVARTAVVPERDEVEARVAAWLEAAGLKGATVGEIEAAVPGPDRKGLLTVLGRLVKARDIERLGDLHVASTHLRALTEELRRLAADPNAPAALEVGWFKERYGLTRKAAIPLLEWLDRTRVTRRQGEARVLVGRT